MLLTFISAPRTWLVLYNLVAGTSARRRQMYAGFMPSLCVHQHFLGEKQIQEGAPITKRQSSGYRASSRCFPVPSTAWLATCRISLTTGKTCLPIECRENPAGLQCLAGPQHRCNLRIHSALFLRALGTAELRNCWDSIRVSVSPVKYQELLCSSIQRICFANRVVEWIKLATKPSD